MLVELGNVDLSLLVEQRQELSLLLLEAEGKGSVEGVIELLDTIIIALNKNEVV